MAEEKTSKTITYAKAKGICEGLPKDCTPAEVQDAFEQRYEMIQDAIRRGFSEYEAVYGAILDMNIVIY
jgi:hypothetical protein